MKQRIQGFILLELIVALTLIGIGFSVLFSSMSGSARNIARLEKFQSREQSTKNLLAELDLIQSLRTGDAASGSFEDGTRWRLTAETYAQTPQNPTPLLRIVLRLEWNGNSGILTRNIETYRLARTAGTPRSLDDQLRELR